MDYSTKFICYATCVNDVQLVQIKGGTQYIQYSFVMQLLHVDDANLSIWSRGVEHSTISICYAACADEEWNTCTIFIIICNLRKWHWICAWCGVEHSTIIHFGYAACVKGGCNTNLRTMFCFANDVKLVQMRVKFSKNVHLLCTLCKWEVEHSIIFICYAVCANGVELVQIKVEHSIYNIHLLCNFCRWCQLVHMRGGTQ